MAVIENRFVCDLSKPVQAQALKGNVFSLDNLGSRLSVLIYNNGQPATISGIVTANCILPDGSTVNVNGGLTTENGGSKAYVDVPQSCLLIPGILKIAIKCTSSSVITTLAAIVANVYMTKTDNIITPSQQIINDWNAEISAAIATQNAAIANQDTKINDLKSALSQMADIPDALRKLNVIDDAQYDSDQTLSGVTVHAVKYSGFKLTGSIANDSNMYLTRPSLSFSSSKKYTLIVLSDELKHSIKVGFRPSGGGFVKDSNNTSVLTDVINEPIVFTPYTNYSGAYLAIRNTTGSSISLDETIYVYLMEGEYTLEDISVLKKLIEESSDLTYDETAFVNDKYNAIRTNGWQSLDYADARIYKDGFYMDSTGALVRVPEQRVLQIKDAGGIYRIKFSLHTSIASYPLFVVKDINGTVKRVMLGDIRSQLLDQNDYLVFPGGLAAGSTIYMNWFNANDPGNEGNYVKHIDIQYEKLLSKQANGKDLFDPAEALATGTLYFQSDTGAQHESTTYCAGEAKIKAGDVFRTYRNCVIAYFDAYGAFISGENASGNTFNTYTAPANTNGAMISFKVSEISLFGVDRDEMHFTVPVNQSILKNGENSADYVDNESSIVNVNAVLKLPKTYTESGNPVPIIAIMHGSGFGVSATEWGTNQSGSIGASTPFDNMINGFTLAGYAVCDINGYDNSVPCNTWGSQRGILAYRKMIEYVLSNYNVEKDINIYAFSMGGMVAFNFMNMNRDIVKCAAVASASVDLYNQAFMGSSSWKNAIITSYGFTGDSWDDNTSLTEDYNPMGRLITISDKEYDFTCYPFIRFWHGASDSDVSYTYAQRLCNAIRNAGRDCTFRLVTGAAHEICYGSNAKCNNEYVYWFNRFNDTLLS